MMGQFLNLYGIFDGIDGVLVHLAYNKRSKIVGCKFCFTGVLQVDFIVHIVPGIKVLGLTRNSLLISFLGLLAPVYKRQGRVNGRVRRNDETEGPIACSWMGGVFHKGERYRTKSSSTIDASAKGHHHIWEVLVLLAPGFVMYHFEEYLYQRSIKSFFPLVSLWVIGVVTIYLT